MTKLKAIFVVAGLALFTIGCEGTTAPPTEAEEKANQASMDADMQNMTGKISEKPGEGKTKDGKDAEATP